MRRLLEKLRVLRESRRIEREARRLLASAFDDPALLRGTSLRPEHRNRVMVVRHACEGGRVKKVWFTILRHPRPYAFSRQHHEVLELWSFDAAARRLERLEGSNLTRARGSDGDPPLYGPDA